MTRPESTTGSVAAAATAGAAAAPTGLVAEVVALLRTATGADAGWAAGIGPDSRLDGELRVDSVELAALGELLRQRFGPAVDLAGYVAGLELDEIIELTVGEVARYVATCRPAGPGSGPA